MSDNRYTAAMIAELVDVHVSRVRWWQRRGWIVPAEHQHRLAYFDFSELTVARQLAEFHRLGATPKLIEKKLAEIQRRFPDVKRPLAELTLVLDGRTLLVRRGGDLVEPGGQLRLDFDALHRDKKPLRTIEELAEFYAGYGVDPKLFLSTAQSFVVEGKLAHGNDLVKKYGVQGTPSLILNGKYQFSATSAGGFPQTTELVKYLVAKELGAKKGK